MVMEDSAFGKEIRKLFPSRARRVQYSATGMAEVPNKIGGLSRTTSDQAKKCSLNYRTFAIIESWD